MAEHVTYSQILRGLQDEIGKHGYNYVYPAQMGVDGSRSCRYWHVEDKAPGCIVGRVFHALGATQDQLRRYENDSALAVMEGLEEDEWTFEDSDKISDLLCQTQAAQDNGATWGWALQNALYIQTLKEENSGNR